MYRFIITGHGTYASGLKGCIEALAGVNEEVDFIDFETVDTEVTLEEKLRGTLEKYTGESIIFICDIVGGTPFKTATKLASEQEDREVVTGVNVLAIIQAVLENGSMSLEETAQNLIIASKHATIRLKEVTEGKNKETEEIIEGI